MNKQNESILRTSRRNFEHTAKKLNLDSAMRERILEPKEKIEFNTTPILSDRRFINISMFIVRHNDALGPAKGGIRITADVSLEDITGLAMEMTWKTALIGVPFGGGKSGIRFAPHMMSDEDKEAVIRAFTRAASRNIGPEIYVPAPDMGTNEKDMAHIRDCISYSEGISITKGCYVTGKPVILGGIVGRREATGKGVVYTTLAMCEELGLDIKKMRVAVQGFGNVGAVAAKEIIKYGASVVAVSDVFSGLVNEEGLDMDALLKHVEKTGTVKGFEHATEVEGYKILEVDCDILIPAAKESQITVQNVDNIKAKIIAEGANAPTTPNADEILKQRGIYVIPDILCNAGGVFVSYLEYTQETQREQMVLAQVEQRLAERMEDRFTEVYRFAADNEITMREAAMEIAVSKVVEAVVARGFLP